MCAQSRTRKAGILSGLEVRFALRALQLFIISASVIFERLIIELPVSLAIIEDAILDGR